MAETFNNTFFLKPKNGIRRFDVIHGPTFLLKIKLFLENYFTNHPI